MEANSAVGCGEESARTLSGEVLDAVKVLDGPVGVAARVRERFGERRDCPSGARFDLAVELNDGTVVRAMACPLRRVLPSVSRKETPKGRVRVPPESNIDRFSRREVEAANLFFSLESVVTEDSFSSLVITPSGGSVGGGGGGILYLLFRTTGSG